MSRMYEIQHGNAPRCQHVFDSNLQCQSPALRGRDFCYWHFQNRKRNSKFTVPLLETEKAIQVTLSHVLREVYDGKMDTKRANSMFYGLSLAMYNVRHISFGGGSDHIIDLPPAMMRSLDEGENVRTGALARSGSRSEQSSTTHSAPEAWKSGESNDSAPEAWKSDESNDSAPEAWKSGASAPRCEDKEDGALAPVDTAPKFPPQSITPSDHQIPTSSAHQMTLPPEHFAAPHPLDSSAPFLLREQRFTRDEIRAYWTQHLPAEVRNLRNSNGELFYDGPDWLPLTQEEIEFLRHHKAENRGAGTPEENFWYERLIKHHSQHNILPPKPHDIFKHYQAPDSNKSLAELLTDALLKRAPKLA